MKWIKESFGKDPIYPIIVAYLLTIAITLAWEVYTNK